MSKRPDRRTVYVADLEKELYAARKERDSLREQLRLRDAHIHELKAARHDAKEQLAVAEARVRVELDLRRAAYDRIKQMEEALRGIASGPIAGMIPEDIARAALSPSDTEEEAEGVKP